MIIHEKNYNYLQLISDHLPDMLWVKDTSGRYLFANRSICENLLMATHTEEPLGKTDIYFAQREREKNIDNLEWHTFGELCFNSDEEVLRHMKPMRFEEHGNLRGECVYLDVNKAPLFDAENNLIGVIGSGRDITAQKKLEREHGMTQRLIESGPVVVFEWKSGEGWPIQYVSANVNARLGLDYEALMTSSAKFTDFIHPDDITRVSEEVAGYFESRTEMFVQEYRLLREDSSVIWIKDFTVVEYQPDILLPVSIKGYIVDNTLEKIADERAAYLSYYDQLTGLPNRQKMLLDMQTNSPRGCAIFNIDSFREINDFFGVDNGDDLLVQLANKAKKMGDTVYRIGGDEFAVLLTKKIPQDVLKEQIENVLREFDRMTFTVQGEKLRIRLRVGIAFGERKLLSRADIALHTAKEKRVPYAVFELKDNIEEKYQKNIQMASSVHKALEDGRIICHYQPIVDVATGKIGKYETLVRMIDEEGNMIPPMEFLPVAKKMQLYSQITQKVVHLACEAFCGRDEQFSINLSIDDIENPYTLQEIIGTIIKTNTATRIIFEILESEGIENYESVIRFATQVKALGAKIAIDDFGTGYSNFEHILRLNVDSIKIDGSLIQGIVSNKRHRIIVETIVEFAKKMGAETIAEFVSDEEILETVKKLGIEYSQGYHTGKPGELS